MLRFYLALFFLLMIFIVDVTWLFSEIKWGHSKEYVIPGFLLNLWSDVLAWFASIISSISDAYVHKMGLRSVMWSDGELRSRIETYDYQNFVFKSQGFKEKDFPWLWFDPRKGARKKLNMDVMRKHTGLLYDKAAVLSGYAVHIEGLDAEIYWGTYGWIYLLLGILAFYVLLCYIRVPTGMLSKINSIYATIHSSAILLERYWRNRARKKRK
jgi:hypothetical protein